MKHLYVVQRYTDDEPPVPYKVLLIVESESSARYPAVECCCWCWEHTDTPEECPCHEIGANCLTVEVGCPCENTPDSPNLYMCFESYDEGSEACVWQNGFNEGIGEGECFLILQRYPDQLVPPDYDEPTTAWGLIVSYYGEYGPEQATYYYYGEWDCLTALTLDCRPDPTVPEYDTCNNCTPYYATVTPGFVPTEE